MFKEAQLLQPLQRFQRADGPGRIGLQRGGAVGVDADVVEDGGGFVGGVVAPDVGDDFLREVKRPAPGAENGRGAADAAVAAVVQEAFDRAAIAAQDGGGDVGFGVGCKAPDRGEAAGFGGTGSWGEPPTPIPSSRGGEEARGGK